MKNRDILFLSQAITAWQKQHGRRHLPWQINRTAYRVWLSEIMLQQTQVMTVLPYFERFIARFSDIHCLASASIDEVLFLWSGLGYYSRARNLHRAARMIVTDFGGVFPNNIEDLQKLPGVGRSTAGAIMVFAYDQIFAILDGNVKRVLTRYFAIGESINLTSTEKLLWRLSEQCLPRSNIATYTQGIMDLGATVCTRNKPSCEQCPACSSCLACRKNLQNSLPNRQKQKKKPVRQASFILVSQQQRILLKQNPPKGIWGGLWCLPQQAELSQLKAQPVIAMGPKWLEFRHTFSHFHLDCEIYQATFDKLCVLPDGWVWYNRDYPLVIGLASPIKKVINQWFSVRLDCVADSRSRYKR